jgi:YesN/AraC family two-component response regulator
MSTLDDTAPVAAETTVRKVLVVDDTFASRQLLTRMLHQFARVDVREARDGLTAFDQFCAIQPDITFLDIDMPHKSGIDVLKEIRAAAPQSYVVMVSAAASLETVQSTLELKVGGFVVKPYSARRILDVLTKYARETGASDLLRED